MSTSVNRIIKSGFWLYAMTIVNNVMGFVYWITITKIAGVNTIGTVSAAIGLSTLIGGISSLGIGVGIQHLIGGCASTEAPKECVQKIFWNTLYLTLATYATGSVSLLVLGGLCHRMIGLANDMLVFSSVLVLLSSAVITQSTFTALLMTKELFLMALAGNAAKLVIGISLVFAGMGAVGAIVGFMITWIPFIVAGDLYIMRSFGKPVNPDIETIKNIIRSSVVSWVPGLVTVAGQWVGVLAVFGSWGEIETGNYYIAFTIANFVLGIGTMIVGLLLPVLSGLKDQREEVAHRVLAVSLTMVAPIAVYIAEYPSVVLSLLGNKYIDASASLSVLILSFLPLMLYSAVNSLLYSHRYYGHVLYMGLFQNIPRVILYLALVPSLGGVGAAISFSIGTCVGAIYAIIISKKIGFSIDWGRIIAIIVIPFSIMTPFRALSINPVIVGLSIILSYILYGRIGAMKRSDVMEIISALFGLELSKRIYKKLSSLINFFFPE